MLALCKFYLRPLYFLFTPSPTSDLLFGNILTVCLRWQNPHVLVLDEPTNFLDRDSLGGLSAAVQTFKGGVIMISHNEEFVGAVCSEHFYVNDGRVSYRGPSSDQKLAAEESAANGSSVPASVAASVATTAANSAVSSAVNSGAEDGEMKFKAKKKRKMTKKELKEREVRRRLRHIEWLNSPKGTPHPPDTDDEA